jgi:hypothetical protein
MPAAFRVGCSSSCRQIFSPRLAGVFVLALGSDSVIVTRLLTGAEALRFASRQVWRTVLPAEARAWSSRRLLLLHAPTQGPHVMGHNSRGQSSIAPSSAPDFALWRELGLNTGTGLVLINARRVHRFETKTRNGPKTPLSRHAVLGPLSSGSGPLSAVLPPPLAMPGPPPSRGPSRREAHGRT